MPPNTNFVIFFGGVTSSYACGPLINITFIQLGNTLTTTTTTTTARPETTTTNISTTTEELVNGNNGVNKQNAGKT